MDNQLIKCPECGAEKTDIKQYKLYKYLIFFVFGATFETQKFTCCGQCMRTTIVRKTFNYNILTAWAIWPLTILPMHAIKFFCTYIPGHSNSVIHELTADQRNLTNIENEKISFKERMEKLDDLELLKIIELRNEYQPLAAIEAIKEGLKRNLIDEQCNILTKQKKKSI